MTVFLEECQYSFDFVVSLKLKLFYINAANMTGWLVMVLAEPTMMHPKPLINTTVRHILTPDLLRTASWSGTPWNHVLSCWIPA